MPKIPRSEYSFAYTPSKPVLAPLSLADYSAWTDALDKGAAFAAHKYHAKQDAEANVNRNLLSNAGDNFLIEEEARMDSDTDAALKSGQIDSYQRFSSASEERVKAFMQEHYDSKSDIISGYSTAQRTAFEITKQNIEAKAQALRTKNEAKHIASVGQRQKNEWENKIITNIYDLNVPLDKTLSDVKVTMEVREKLAMAGGKLESPEQFAANQRALQLRMGEAVIGRYKSQAIQLITDGYIQKKSDLTSPIGDTKDVSIGKYNSYHDFLRGVVAGDFKEFHPEKNNLMLAQEINKEVQAALVTAQVARDKVGKLNFDAYMNELLTRAMNTNVTPSPAELDRLNSLANAAGLRMPAQAFNFFEKIKTDATSFQENNFRQLESEISAEVMIATGLNSPPDLDNFYNKVREGLYKGSLHPKHGSILLNKLIGEQRGVNKNANAMTGRIMKTISQEFKTFKRTPKERNSRWKIITSMLGTDLDHVVRGMVLEAHRNAQGSGEAVNESKLADTIIRNLTASIRGRDPAKIDIPEEDLRDVFGKVVAHMEDKEANPLDPLDKAIYHMARVKMERNRRFLDSKLATAYQAAIQKRGGHPLQYPHGIPVGDAEKLSEEIGFIFPGHFSYSQLYNEFFGKKEAVEGSAGEATVAEEKDDSPVIELPSTGADVTEEGVPNAKEQKALINELPDGPVKDAALKALTGTVEDDKGEESVPAEEVPAEEVPEGEPSPEQISAVQKEYYDQVDAFREANKDMSFAKRMSKLMGAKSPEERDKYVADWIYESDKVLNNVLGPAWADLKESFRQDGAAFGRLVDLVVREYGSPEHENPPLEELPRLLFQAIHPASKQFTQWLQGALSGKSEAVSEVESIEPLALVTTDVGSPASGVSAREQQNLPEKDISVDLPEKKVVAKKPVTRKSVAKKPITGTPLERALAETLARPDTTNERAELRKLSREHKGPLITDLIRDKIIDAIVKIKIMGEGVSMSSFAKDLFSPKKRAKDIAETLSKAGWIRVDKPSTKVGLKSKGKVGMKRGDAYNYLFELSVNILRNNKISKAERDSARAKMDTFNKMYRDASGLEPIGEVDADGVRRTTGKAKSQKHVDAYVVSLVREFELMIKMPRFSQLGAL